MANFTMFKSLLSLYAGFKICGFISALAITFMLLYLPPEHMKDVISSGCASLASCSLEALARVLDGRLA